MAGCRERHDLPPPVYQALVIDLTKHPTKGGERGRERGRKERREGGTEERREGGREEGREGGREDREGEREGEWDIQY